MEESATRPAKVPPSWFIHIFWRVHRWLNRVSGGRFLWTPASKRGWGALKLTATGRKSGEDRSVILGYLEDGNDYVVLAMNGWEEGHPSWWLNLQAHPEASVSVAKGGSFPVRAYRVVGAERDRQWKRWAQVDVGLDELADRRQTETPVIVLEPHDRPAPTGKETQG